MRCSPTQIYPDGSVSNGHKYVLYLYLYLRLAWVQQSVNHAHQLHSGGACVILVYSSCAMEMQLASADIAPRDPN
jgi:hypothetical protein